MYEPTWKTPLNKTEALAALSDAGPHGRPIAGGTDLAVRIRGGSERPPVLVDLGRLEELKGRKGTARPGEKVVLGALTTHRCLARDPAVSRSAAVLSEACGHVGGPQIRSRGTIGGNLSNASPAADGAVALLALGATVVLESADGGGASREVPLDQFFLGPGETVLREGELLTLVRYDAPAEGATSAYLKAGQRNALAIAIASVAVCHEPEAGSFSIALGSVGPTPLRARDAERMLSEAWSAGRVGAEVVEAAGRAAANAACCITDVRASAEYRTLLVEALTARALKKVLKLR